MSQQNRDAYWTNKIEIIVTKKNKKKNINKRIMITTITITRTRPTEINVTPLTSLTSSEAASPDPVMPSMSRTLDICAHGTKVMNEHKNQKK